MKLIGISGKKGRGKDTAASIILKHYPKYEIKRFSDKLKQIVALLLGLDPESLESQQTKSEEVFIFGKLWTVRELLQFIGTDLFRDQLHPDVWVDSLFIDCWGDNYVIPDVRFPNEADAIREQGGVLIRIERNGKIDQHKSETALDHYLFDYTINNNRDLEKLENEILWVLGKFFIEAYD